MCSNLCGIVNNRIKNKTMPNSIENPQSSETYTSRILINIFRHSEAERGDMPDEERELTPHGRDLAMKKSSKFKRSENIEQSVAIGSLRKRTKSTAAIIMAAPVLTGEETLEELKAKLDEGRNFGSKIAEDERLNFRTDTKEYLDSLTAAYNDGRLLPFVVNESDMRAKAVGDNGSTYSRMAGNIAELINRYMAVSPKFDELVKTNGYQNLMERFLGTHQSISESFLLKVVEKTKGIEERNKLLGVLGGGFDLVEGFQVEIQSVVGNPKAVIHYEKKDNEGKIIYELHEEIPIEILAEIINEGKNN